MINPLDDQLKTQCAAIMLHHFKKKGDSWQSCTMNYLFEKLVEEFAEIILAARDIQQTQKTGQFDQDAKDNMRKELADMINVCAMLHQRLRD